MSRSSKIIAIGLVLGWSVVGAGQSSGAQLTVVGPRVSTKDADHAEYNFGDLKQLDVKSLDCAITLHNPGQAPAVVQAVTTSCGCTTAVIGAEPRTKLPYTLSPGADVVLKASIDGDHVGAGDFRKTITVASDSGDLVIALVGHIAAPAELDVQQINFGKVKLGDHHPLQVILTLDPRVADIPVKLIPGDSNIAVRQIDPHAWDAPPAAGGKRTVSYELSIKAEPRLGYLDGLIGIIPSRSVTSDGRLYEPRYVPLSGEVDGSVTASPTEAIFGLIKPNIGSSMQVDIKGKNVSAKTLTLSSDSPLVHVAAASGSGKPNDILVKVTVGPGLPEGYLSTLIHVVGPDGKRFVIPVIATASKFASVP